MSKITFEKLNEAPQAEGVYLYVNGFFPLDKEFVHVYWVPPVSMGGLDFEGYWACRNDRPVKVFRGQWYREVAQAERPVAKQVEVEVHGDQDWSHF